MNRPEPTLGLRHVALQVRDLEACERFYTNLLGMRVEWRPDPDNVYLTGRADNLALHRIAGAHADAAQQRLDHIAFMLKRIEQVDAWHAFLRESGVSILKSAAYAPRWRAQVLLSRPRWQYRTLDLSPTACWGHMNPIRPYAQHAASHPVRLAYVQHLPQATQAFLGEIHFGTSPALPDSTLYPVAWIYMGFSPMLMEKVLQIKATFPWPLGSSLPSMILAGGVYLLLEWGITKRRDGLPLILKSP